MSLIDRVEGFMAGIVKGVLIALLAAWSIGAPACVIYLVWHFARKYW